MTVKWTTEEATQEAAAYVREVTEGAFLVEVDPNSLMEVAGYCLGVMDAYRILAGRGEIRPEFSTLMALVLMDSAGLARYRVAMSEARTRLKADGSW
ncbi:hypothetical protein ACQEVY_25345 [Streptomyces sp. CA-288835]|uniref:hypothetical protein n=1 Tax=Streptomyces sp. CA-288835 TaxID=3240069 RepID=UPI003D8CEC5D